MGTRITEPRRAVDIERAIAVRATPEPGLDLAVELAHDVRSPLGAMITITELLEGGACGPVTEAQVRQLHNLQDAARALAQLTEDVVESGRIGALDVRGHAVPFSVDEVLGTVQDITQPMADSAGLELVVRNHAPPKWAGRRGAIARVLVNLVTNSLKYTERGCVVLGARIDAVNRVRFYVNDGGCGPSHQSVRRDNPGTGVHQWRSSSAGLGLAICRRLLHAMGTTLEVESSPGAGTQYSFVLALPDSA